MASAASYRRRSDSGDRHSMYSVRPSSHRDHELEPDLVPSSSSSSSSSSKSSRRRELQRQMDELDRYTQQTRVSHDAGDRFGGEIPHQHRHPSANRGSDEQDMIMRGADIVRAQLHADSSRRETENVHRGASIVREQIILDQNRSQPSGSSPRGVSSPFVADGGGVGMASKYGDRRHDSRDIHQESKRVLEEVDELSDRLQHNVSFDRQETRQADNTSTKGSDSSLTSSKKYHYKGSDSSVTSSKYHYKGSDSSVTSSKYHYKGSDSSMTSSKYHYHFDPFAEEDGEEDGITVSPAIREGPQATDGTFMAGRDHSIKFKVEDDGGRQEYESIMYEDGARNSRSLGGMERYQESHGHDHGEQIPTHRESSMPSYGRRMIPMERSRAEHLRQSRPSTRPRSSSDKAYEHAMRAGLLWQTLVGEHVRFPKDWWGGARTPNLGDSSCEPSKWWYISRHRVRGNEMLNGWVRNRTSAGRLLLHIIVSDSVTGPVQDIAIGCFHPNARGVRRTTKPILDDENVREIWMAIRKRERLSSRDTNRGREHDALSASLLNTALTLGHGIEDVGQPSPLGERYSVTNDNMRAVFGDKPPISTFEVPSQELYKIIIDAVEESRFRGQASPYPARTILQEFLFTKRC